MIIFDKFKKTKIDMSCVLEYRPYPEIIIKSINPPNELKLWNHLKFTLILKYKKYFINIFDNEYENGPGIQLQMYSSNQERCFDKIKLEEIEIYYESRDEEVDTWTEFEEILNYQTKNNQIIIL